MIRATFNHQGMAVPVVVCDGCGQPIEDHRLGLVQLHRDGEARFLHKAIDGPGCDDGSINEGWLEIADFLDRLKAAGGPHAAPFGRHAGRGSPGL